MRNQNMMIVWSKSKTELAQKNVFAGGALLTGSAGSAQPCGQERAKCR